MDRLNQISRRNLTDLMPQNKAEHQNSRCAEEWMAKFIGKGLTSNVFVATEEGVRTCVKSIPFNKKVYRTHEEFVEATDREVFMLQACAGHPNILQLHAYDDSNQHPKLRLIQTELCDSSLFALMTEPMWRRHRDAMWERDFSPCSFPLNYALSYAAEILDGIAHIHSLGFIHGDIKLLNILRSTTKTGEELVKIADFGLTDTQRGMDLSPHRWGQGTHLAPEQHIALALHPVYSGAEIVRRSMRNRIGGRAEHYTRISNKIDIWAFAISFAHMLIGTIRAPISKDDLMFNECHHYGSRGYEPTAEKIIRKLPEELQGEPEYPQICEFFRAALAHCPVDRPSAVEIQDRFPMLFGAFDDELETDLVVEDNSVGLELSSRESSPQREHALQAPEEEPLPAAAPLESIPEVDLEDSFTSAASSSTDIFASFLRSNEHWWAIKFLEEYQRVYDEFVWEQLPTLRSFLRSGSQAFRLFERRGVAQWLGYAYDRATEGARRRRCFRDRFRWNARMTPAIHHWRFLTD